MQAQIISVLIAFQAAIAQTSMRIRAVSPEPSLLGYTIYGVNVNAMTTQNIGYYIHGNKTKGQFFVMDCGKETNDKYIIRLWYLSHCRTMNV